MSSIIFGYTMSLIDAATPSTGFLVAYDSDGIIKQKDSDGVITPICSTSSTGLSATPSLAQVLSLSNDSATYSILMGTATSIIMGSSSVMTSQNGLSKLYLDYNSATSSVYLTTGYNYLSLTNGTMSLINGLGNSINISNTSNYVKLTSTYSEIFSTSEVRLKVYNLSDEILLKSNIGIAVSSANHRNSAIFIGSQNSTFAQNIVNSVIIGGSDQYALLSNSVYITDTYIQDTKKLRGSLGDASLSFTDTNNLILENSSSLIAIISSSSSTSLTTNGLIVSDTTTNSVYSPDIYSSPVFISTKNSIIQQGVQNSVIIGGENLISSLTNSVVLGEYVNINNAYTLPSIDGSSGQTIITDGLGNISWQTTSLQGLSQVLEVSNYSGIYSIQMGTATSIYTSNGGGQIYLDYNGPNSILISTYYAGLSESYIQLDTSDIIIEAASNLNISSTTASIVISNGEGLVYGFDYSSTFVTYSLVDKNYVDLGTASIWSTINSINNDFISEVTTGLGLTGGGTSGTVYLDVNVDNGLSISSNNVVLGGTLSQDTTINGNLQDFIINGTNYVELGVSGSGSVKLRNNNGIYDTNVLVDAQSGYAFNVTSQFGGGTYSNLSVNDQQIKLITIDGTAFSQVYFEINTTNQSVGDGSINNKIIVSDNFGKGMVYNGDYTANFTTYSIVTKGYVDSAISSSAAIKYSEVKGFTASVTETISHNLGTDEIVVQAYDSSGYMIIPGSVQINGVNNVDLTFSHTLSSVKIVVIG